MRTSVGPNKKHAHTSGTKAKNIFKSEDRSHLALLSHIRMFGRVEDGVKFSHKAGGQSTYENDSPPFSVPHPHVLEGYSDFDSHTSTVSQGRASLPRR